MGSGTIKIIFVSLIFLMVPDPIYAASDYTVNFVRGTVEIWHIQSPKWNTVESGSALPAEGLLRITPEASIEFSYTEHKSKKKIKISTPMILRLSGDITREVKENEILLSKIPDKWQSDGDPLLLTFDEVWQRTQLKIKDFVDLSAKTCRAAPRPPAKIFALKGQKMKGRRFFLQRAIKYYTPIICQRNCD